MLEATNTSNQLGTKFNDWKCFLYDLSIEYQIDEFMIYCRSRELRAKTLESYEHTLRLFERWCNDELDITQVDQVTESVIRRYITNLQERGKYTFYANEKSKEQNFPERRRDFRKPVSAATINNYIRNLKVFFNWLDSDYVLKKNPMKKVRQLKTNRNAKEYISDEDFKRLVGQLDQPTCFLIIAAVLFNVCGDVLHSEASKLVLALCGLLHFCGGELDGLVGEVDSHFNFLSVLFGLCAWSQP